MPEIVTDKRKESLQALKAANKHLTDVFAQLDRINQVAGDVASDLNRLASKIGEINVEVWYDGKYQQRPLKATLSALADKLEKARS